MGPLARWAPPVLRAFRVFKGRLDLLGRRVRRALQALKATPAPRACQVQSGQQARPDPPVKRDHEDPKEPLVCR